MSITDILTMLLIAASMSSGPNGNATKNTMPKWYDNDSTDMQTDSEGYPVQAAKVDSLKWNIYAFNFEDTAMSEASHSVKVSPLACSLRLMDAKREGGDSMLYFFDVYYKDVHKRYVFPFTNFTAIGVVNNKIQYLVAHAFFMGVTNKILGLQQARFSAYLQHYRGEMDMWLRNEAIKRKILPYAFSLPCPLHYWNDFWSTLHI